MARAISTSPKFLMLDEPSAGMSPDEAKGIADFIKRLRDEQGFTIIVVEHNLTLVRSISDRVIALAFGHKIAEGPYEEVVENPCVMETCFGRRPLPKSSRSTLSMGAGRLSGSVTEPDGHSPPGPDRRMDRSVLHNHRPRANISRPVRIPVVRNHPARGQGVHDPSP